MDIRLRLLRVAQELDKKGLEFSPLADELHFVVSQLLPERGIFRSPKSKGGLRSRVYSVHDGKVYDKNGNCIGTHIDEEGNIFHESGTEPVGKLSEKSIRIFRKKKEEKPTEKPTLTDQTVFEKDRK